jgi:hypothetical protein
MTSGDPISYKVVQRGTAVVSSDGEKFGEVDHVLADEEADLFDGIVVKTDDGIRFVDADQVRDITTERVTCTFDRSGVHTLSQPDGAPVYSVDVLRAESKDLNDRISHLFGRKDWRRKKSDE